MNDHFFIFLRNMNDNFLCGQKNTDVLGLFFNWLKKKYKPEIMWISPTPSESHHLFWNTHLLGSTILQRWEGAINIGQ